MTSYAIRFLFILLVVSFHGKGQTFPPSGETFEMRYYTQDTLANGETDLKGGTAWMDLPSRIDFLHAYTDYASDYFGDPGLDTRLVADSEIAAQLAAWKAQPTTAVRRTLDLSGWKYAGYREGQREERSAALRYWGSFDGAEVRGGRLLLSDARISHGIDTVDWRFRLEFTLHMDGGGVFELGLGSGHSSGLQLLLSDSGVSLGGQAVQLPAAADGSMATHVLLEGDLAENGFNCYVNGRLTHDFVPAGEGSLSAPVHRLRLGSSGRVEVDDLLLFNYVAVEGDTIQPFRSHLLLDEDFEPHPGIDGWQLPGFDDSGWAATDLPAVHGGIREQQESLYLRKDIFVDAFQRAMLSIETLDQAGEIWINGEVAAVTSGRHPQEVDVTEYLKAGQPNLIAIRVKPYYSHAPMLHSPDDRHIGWSLGRTKLLLSTDCMIASAEAHTHSLSDGHATQRHSITLQHHARHRFKGRLVVNYYPWFPEEGEKVAAIARSVEVRPQVDNVFSFDLDLPEPRLWSGGNPNLYKVEVVLQDSAGTAIDDYVFTTGVRTVGQANGDFLVNGQPEMLNGAQVMGFRTPLETMAKYNRSAPTETIVETFLALKKMGANMLRLHVHAEKDTTDGINDPRYAELADQLGIYLIWSTAGFIREGEAWNVDFEGYPQYIGQVYNHPSIVIWEASNHPNRFKDHDVSDTHDYVSRIYNVICGRDSSRLISPTSFWQHTHYANHAGTVDRDGNPIEAVAEFHAPRMTRGSQDAYSGYGAEWSRIRNMPNAWAASVLSAEDMAYFNFEHEESAAQPNWDLHKGKPWYRVPSYEWEYELGSIGKKLDFGDWRASQGYQAFSAWESMKKQMLLGYDGFSWCTLEGGANMGTYQKPLLDNLGHPKLAYYINRMVFQRTWAASDDVDVVYGPDDRIRPVIHHIGGQRLVDLKISLRDPKGKTLEQRVFDGLQLPSGRTVHRLPEFQFKRQREGVYFIHYEVVDR